MHIDAFGQRHRYGPPPGYTPPAQEVFCVGEEWSRLVERGLQFPPYSGPTTRFGARGSCLEPLVTDRHMLLTRAVDPDEPLIDGSLVCIEWLDAEEAQRHRDAIGVVSKDPIVICKIARIICGEWYLLCKDSITPLLDNLIVAAVVAVLPLTGCAPQAAVHARAICENPFSPSPTECSGLGLNAASQIGSNFSASGGAATTSTASPAYATAVSITLTCTGYPVSIDVSGTYFFATGSIGTPVATLSIYRDGVALASGGSFTTGTLPNSTTSTPTPFSMIASDLPSAGTHTYSLVVESQGAIGALVDTSVVVSNAYLKVREYKR
jgi:hypothetical protein